MMVRGVRGAIDVPVNTEDAIMEATHRLFKEIIFRNSIPMEEIASIILSATADLDAAFPAKAIRSLGLTSIPLMCTQEINVPGAMSRVIRVLIHINTDKKQSEIIHCFLDKTANLRPDIGGEER
jgi:chorismate mutase